MSEVIYRPFEDRDAKAFASLNLAWIEQNFCVEDSDRAQLLEARKNIIDQGGYIVVAELDGEIVGTGALVSPHYVPDDGHCWMEIIKMATSPKAQGRGIGGVVIDKLIDRARALGADRIWLETNDALGPAVRLYERKGFRALSEHELWETPYARCNLQMVCEI